MVGHRDHFYPHSYHPTIYYPPIVCTAPLPFTQMLVICKSNSLLDQYVSSLSGFINQLKGRCRYSMQILCIFKQACPAVDTGLCRSVGQCPIRRIYMWAAVFQVSRNSRQSWAGVTRCRRGSWQCDTSSAILLMVWIILFHFIFSCKTHLSYRKNLEPVANSTVMTKSLEAMTSTSFFFSLPQRGDDGFRV